MDRRVSIIEKRFTCQNLHGTFMWKDKPLFCVKMKDGLMKEFNPFMENRTYFPYIMQSYPTEERFKQEMTSRLFPPTRQNLQRVLDDLEITEYNVDDIIASNYALNIKDHRWFKPYGSPLVYDDIKIRY